jgi:SAM-dependent methyltransferase
MTLNVFDEAEASRFNESRRAFLDGLLPDLIRKKQLSTALDVGCGYGYFSKWLSGLGLRVTGIDGRRENVAEASRRYPNISFQTFDIEHPSITGLGSVDLVLCMGLLYHLENPFRAIRNLCALSRLYLVIETQTAPHRSPVTLLCEEGVAINQSLAYTACVPSRSCLVKMLYRAGFPNVYGAIRPPDHSDFHGSLFRRKLRIVMLASKEEVDHSNFRAVPEPRLSGMSSYRNIFRVAKRALKWPSSFHGARLL